MANDTQMSELQSEVWQFLLERFVGVENATPRSAILVRYNLVKKKELSDRAFRQVVSDLVTVFNKGICTTSDAGYYVARTGRELDAAANDLEAKGAACFERARRLRACEPQEKQERLF